MINMIYLMSWPNPMKVEPYETMGEIDFPIHFNLAIAVASDRARRPANVDAARWPLPPEKILAIVMEKCSDIFYSQLGRIRANFEPLPVQARFATRTPAKSAGFMRVKFREWLFLQTGFADLAFLRASAMIFLFTHR